MMANWELNGFQNNSWSLKNFSLVDTGLVAYDPELRFLMKICQTDGIILYSYLIFFSFIAKWDRGRIFQIYD